jgi:N-acetylneuraminate synthase
MRRNGDCSRIPEARVLISDRAVGGSAPPLIVAELSANHNGSLEKALEHVREAKRCGADAIKLQTYTADTLTIDCESEDFRIRGGLWDGWKLYDLYKTAYTPWEWHETLFAEARRVGIIPFSTPFDESAVELLERLDAPAYKIASFELVDPKLLARVARTGRPVILSTGMATLREIAEAVETLRANGCSQLILLHCVSAYPAPASAANLRTIPHMAEAFGVPVGLSDHTLGTGVACAAVALGSCMIEKHFILDRRDGGPDSAFSIEPNQLKDLVTGCRMAWEAKGVVGYALEAAEAPNVVFRRSIFVVRDVKQGAVLSRDDVRVIRPGFGLAPRFLPQVLGRRARRDLTRGEPVTWDLLG